MDAATWQWLATGLAVVVAALCGFIADIALRTANRQADTIEVISRTLGETQNRVSFLEGVVGERYGGD